MQVVNFTPADHAAEYRSQGYVHVRGGISDEFLAYLPTFVAEPAQHRLADLAGKGNKEQALLEFNGSGSDPLGEDPHTAGLRDATLAALEAGSDLDALVPVRPDARTPSSTPAPRGWEEARHVRMYGETPLGISRSQFRAIEAVDGRTPLGELTAGEGVDRDDVLELARRGALDLVAR